MAEKNEKARRIKMDDYTVKRLALILAIQAEIEGMKAENEERMFLGRGVAYDESSFLEKAEELRVLASKHMGGNFLVSIRNPYREYKHYKVPEEVYTYIKQLECYIRHPEKSKLKKFYKDRFGS